MDDLVEKLCDAKIGAISKRDFLKLIPICFGQTLSAIEEMYALIRQNEEFLIRLSFYDYAQPACIVLFAHRRFVFIENYHLDEIAKSIREEVISQNLDKLVISASSEGLKKKVLSVFIEFEKKFPNAGEPNITSPIIVSICFEFYDKKKTFTKSKHYSLFNEKVLDQIQKHSS